MEGNSGHEIGSHRVRIEDPALMTGNAQYTDDITGSTFSGAELAHASICRSQYSNADIVNIDTTDAEAIDGVIAVFTAEDLNTSEGVGTIDVDGGFPCEATKFSILAEKRVRYTGEAVAVVVAENRYIANDAADLIDVDYERRGSVIDIDEALEEDAPLVHESHDDNRFFETDFGNEEAVANAFEDADNVVEVTFENQRLAANPLEPRSAVGDYDPETGSLTAYVSTQHPHRSRDLLSDILDVSNERVHVITPDVGGGFGEKGPYARPGEPLAAWCSIQVERPVKWVGTRTEILDAGPHGRDSVVDVALAFDDNGRVRGLRADVASNLGAYPMWGDIWTAHFQRLLSGAYDIPAVCGTVRSVLTNTAPTVPYRGAGRPESIYTVERITDVAAAEIGMDPAEFRRQNFVPKEAFPFETATGSVYDSGNYQHALDVALEAVDYEAARERQTELRSEERYLGIGIGFFVENTGTPGIPETARVELDASGEVTAYCGTFSHGQGHATSFGQVLSDEFGVDFEDVTVNDGNTADLERGWGTAASRSAPQGASVVVESAREVIENARSVASKQFEAHVEDVEFVDGEFHVAGTSDRSITIQEVAELVHSSEKTAIGPEALRATRDFDLENFAYSFGVHVAIVEVDPDSGEIEFERYVAVDDVGTQLNPLIVEGQVHGGVAQGIGEAMYEQAVYDDNGTLISGSLQDYTLPKAIQVPDIETESTETPTPLNPTGAKGAGEGGTIAAASTVVNAVVDAVSPFGITHLERPLTEGNVWQSIRDASDN